MKDRPWSKKTDWPALEPVLFFVKDFLEKTDKGTVYSSQRIYNRKIWNKLNSVSSMGD